MLMTSVCTGSDFLDADQVVDVVDQAVVVAVGDRARRGGAGLAAGVLVLVVLHERDVGVDAVEVGLAVVGGTSATRSSTQVDAQALVEEGVLLEAGADRLVVVLDGLEDVGVGPVGDGGAGAVGLLHHLQRRRRARRGRRTSGTRGPSGARTTSSRVDSALTTEEPTPCRPPDTL